VQHSTSIHDVGSAPSDYLSHRTLKTLEKNDFFFDNFKECKSLKLNEYCQLITDLFSFKVNKT